MNLKNSKKKAHGQTWAGRKQAAGYVFYPDGNTTAADSQDAPIYTGLIDWRGVAESADLFARRWQLTAELARLNGLLESLEPENIEAAGRLFAGKGGADEQ